MDGGEQRVFTIDLKGKPYCLLNHEDITISKKDWKPTLDKSTFQVLGFERIAYIDCRPGYIQDLKTKGKTENCGIGKILTQLCLNEKDFHEVVNNEDNQAMRYINFWTHTTQKEELLKLEDWIKSNCLKLVSLLMTAEPPSGAYVYFKSALASGFTLMFIEIADAEMYPKNSVCSVEELQKRYNEDGQMVSDGDKVSVYEKTWYFCKPKKLAKLPKCSIS